MKSIIALLCLVALAGALVEARPKRSVIYTATAPVVSSYVAAPVVAAPVVRTAAVVHSHPTTVTKTEQVHSGDHASYSYSTEVKSAPVVHHHTVQTAVAAAPAVATVTHHTVPTYAYSYYHPYSYYSPYHYVVGK